MTSHITIGRVGLDIDLPSLTTWEDAGNSAAIGAKNWALGLDEGVALRKQLLGLAETPEDLVFVSSLDDPARNGWYRVAAGSVSVTTEALFKSTGHLSWSAALTRPRGSSALRPEATTSASVRSGGGVFAGIAENWAVVPSGYVTDHPLSTPTAVGIRYSRSGETMNVIETPGRRFTLTGPDDLIYQNAALIRAGDPLFVQVGRSNSQEPWEVSNGITTVTPPSSAAGLFRVAITDPAGVTGGTQTYEVELGRFSGSWALATNVDWQSWSVTRNAIEQVSIRLLGIVAISSTPYSATLDLLLSRGDRGITALFRSSGSLRWGAAWSSPIISSLVGSATSNNAMEADTPDADSNSPVLCGHDPNDGNSTMDLTNSRVYINSSRKGLDVFAGASSAGTPDAANAILGQFFTPLDVRQRMVAP